MKTGGSLSHRIFRHELAKQLTSMAPMCPRLDRLPPVVEVGESSLFQLTALHFLQSILPRPGAKKQRPQRDCVVCTKPGNRKQSCFECPSCDVCLHLEPASNCIICGKIIRGH
ncbi:hypothetical protein PoB_002937200 [Plakobranchus ocellatus]|uniref:PiggyBac transposable element-derived protein 4 C-terminal zinc-ribbon domain-containing protein n=1 Tax=Plakobranchus ocellatus TaxID=259542 RepID=A0AAV4A7H8_9GAST|nr:hypothetical protein PoB_002937200 [Plakobranchus ocellatus]